LAKFILNTGEEDFDFELLGINCNENQYRLSVLISDALNIDLFLSDYIPLNLKDGKIFKFSLFRFEDNDLGLQYYFIPNLSNFSEPNAVVNKVADLFEGLDIEENVRLIRELPRTDYFLIIKGEELGMFRHKIMGALKSVKEISQVQVIQPQELPSRKNLIF
jgi:hypothetical protein